MMKKGLSPEITNKGKNYNRVRTGFTCPNPRQKTLAAWLDKSDSLYPGFQAVIQAAAQALDTQDATQAASKSS